MGTLTKEEALRKYPWLEEIVQDDAVVSGPDVIVRGDLIVHAAERTINQLEDLPDLEEVFDDVGEAEVSRDRPVYYMIGDDGANLGIISDGPLVKYASWVELLLSCGGVEDWTRFAYILCFQDVYEDQEEDEEDDEAAIVGTYVYIIRPREGLTFKRMADLYEERHAADR